MRPKRLIQNVAVVAYLTLTGAAFFFTMTKLYIPVVPYDALLWSYGMMAPYQGDRPYNVDFVYEGRLPDGSWEAIDLSPYMPMMFAERNVRLALRRYQRYGDDARREKFVQLAIQVLDLERAKGKEYAEVRVWVERWPRSNGGYDFLRKEPFFLERKILAYAQ